MCIPACRFACESKSSQYPEEGTGSPELALQAVVSCLSRVLENKLKSSAGRLVLVLEAEPSV